MNPSDTPMVKVQGRDGFHLYYQDVGFPLASGFTYGPGRLGLVGDQDYVVGPGSVDTDGNEYSWMIDPGEVAFGTFPRVFLDAYADSWGTRDKLKGFEERPLPNDMFLAGDLHETSLSIALGQIGMADDLLFRNGMRLAAAAVHYDTYLTWDCIAQWMANAAAYAGLDRSTVSAQLACVRSEVEFELLSLGPPVSAG